MKALLTTGVIAILAVLFVAGGGLFADDGSAPAGPGLNEQAEQEQGCPTAEQVCALYTGGTCWANTGCEGEDCYEFNRGEEIRVMSLGDAEDYYSVDWLARIPGHASLSGYGRPCEVTPISGSLSKVEIPAEHCAASLMTNKHYYLEFFGSNPAVGCHGWVECQCY